MSLLGCFMFSITSDAGMSLTNREAIGSGAPWAGLGGFHFPVSPVCIFRTDCVCKCGWLSGEIHFPDPGGCPHCCPKHLIASHLSRRVGWWQCSNTETISPFPILVYKHLPLLIHQGITAGKGRRSRRGNHFLSRLGSTLPSFWNPWVWCWDLRVGMLERTLFYKLVTVFCQIRRQHCSLVYLSWKYGKWNYTCPDLHKSIAKGQGQAWKGCLSTLRSTCDTLLVLASSPLTPHHSDPKLQYLEALQTSYSTSPRLWSCCSCWTFSHPSKPSFHGTCLSAHLAPFSSLIYDFRKCIFALHFSHYTVLIYLCIALPYQTLCWLKHWGCQSPAQTNVSSFMKSMYLNQCSQDC